MTWHSTRLPYFSSPNPHSSVPLPLSCIPSGLLRSETLSTVFNLACIHQEGGELTAARELLLAIIRQYPSYVAAHVKLGLMALVSGWTGARVEGVKLEAGQGRGELLLEGGRTST